ncbi:MAG: ubiquinol-cytochrome c reductase iron-sulfur subunit [Limisphaerales bacterium]
MPARSQRNAPQTNRKRATAQIRVGGHNPGHGKNLADGVYTRFRDPGFFIVRRGANLFALSAVCTHRKCRLDAGPDETFHCPCHGSTFDPDGKVTKGPARRNLPLLAVMTNEKGDLLVKLGAT